MIEVGEELQRGFQIQDIQDIHSSRQGQGLHSMDSIRAGPCIMYGYMHVHVEIYITRIPLIVSVL